MHGCMYNQAMGLRRPVVAWAGDSLSVAVMTALVMVFLRPIN